MAHKKITGEETVLRQHRHDRNFIIIDNDVVDDARLTWAARGVHHYMLTRPRDWRFSADRIAEQSPQGRKVVLSALRELELAGYLRRDITQANGGRLTTVTTVSDRPIDEWAKLGAERVAARSTPRKSTPPPASTNVSAGGTGSPLGNPGDDTLETHPSPPAQTDVSAGRTGSPSRNAGDGTPVKGLSHKGRETKERDKDRGGHSLHTPNGSNAHANASAVEPEPAVDDSTVTSVCAETQTTNPDEAIDWSDIDDTTPTPVVEPDVTAADLESALQQVREAIDPGCRDKLTGRVSQRDRIYAALRDAIRRGYSLQQIRTAAAAAGTNAATFAPSTIVSDAIHGMIASKPPRKDTDSPERGSTARSTARICPRGDCRDGRLVCAPECPMTCLGDHDPIGVACHTCHTTAPAADPVDDEQFEDVPHAPVDDPATGTRRQRDAQFAATLNQIMGGRRSSGVNAPVSDGPPAPVAPNAEEEQRRAEVLAALEEQFMRS